ncbi:hypothetical protein Dimus_033446 [Dionaea muscipula]
MSDNGLENVMELIKRQRWENLFKKRLLVHVDAVKEFYAKMTVIHLKKKDVVKSSVKGISIEFDHERLAAILDVPRRTGICEYIKEVWEESRVKSSEMKPFQRFIHFLVMKNVIPRFGKRDTSSFMDLTYMDHLMARRLVNLPRVMMRHMSYVISMKDHELPYGDWLTLVFEAFGVPLVIKKGEEPKKYDFFEDTFLTMCKLTRENGIWWIGSGENRRRDDDEAAPEEEAEEEEERNKDDFDWEAVIDEATVEGESGSDDQFYDAQVGEEEPSDETPTKTSESQLHLHSTERTRHLQSRPSCPIADFRKSNFEIPSEFERKRANRFHDDLEKAKAENARLLALLHQAQTKPHP